MLLENGISGGVEVRKNGYWTLKEKRQKLALKGRGRPDSFSNVNDFISLRVQLKSEEDCYQMLRIIHEYFGRQVDFDRFDQFFGANKRVNGYEALQTTINFKQGAVEVALMTEEMEQFNRWGVVALINKKKHNLDEYALKLVFTPTDSVRFLPNEATGFDYAASIGPRVLADGVSMQVNNEQLGLNIIIPNAATVRINLGETRRAPLPNAEEYCWMPQTREMIASLISLEARDKKVEEGKIIVEKILSPSGLLLITDIEETIYKSLLYKLGCQGVDDLYFLLGSSFFREKDLKKELNNIGVSKKSLGLTTIRLRGSDEAGILGDVSNLIAKMKGNITRVESKGNSGRFELRIVVRGFKSNRTGAVKKELLLDPRFTEVVVV